ncbi:hypothetical protein [Rhodococcus sp. KRD175]|uniref:hypothetical protein n=1 Tax=Rhodococcus sp. KRD175 TaxID=2729729 RepID=UPI001F49AE04|nr:hypothetical protein [Rhodococcus sp. KRD175]
MTVPGTTVGTQRNRVPATRPERAGRGGRSGAALRAYERRQQRASIHTSDSARGSAASLRPTLNGSAIAARIPFVALVIGLLALGLGLTLLLTTRSAGDSYDLSAAKAVNAELAQQRASLQRDVELAESARELARKARGRCAGRRHARSRRRCAGCTPRSASRHRLGGGLGSECVDTESRTTVGAVADSEKCVAAHQADGHR